MINIFVDIGAFGKVLWARGRWVGTGCGLVCCGTEGLGGGGSRLRGGSAGVMMPNSMFGERDGDNNEVVR